MKALRSIVLALAAAAPLAFASPAHALELFTRVPVSKAARPAPENLVGSTAIEFNPSELGAMKPGETAWIDMPNGRRYEITLDRLDQHDNGDLSWVGHVAGESADQLVVVTMGSAGTYATFTLPDGNWGAVPGDANDWLFDADVSDLYIDRSEATDARIPQELVNAIRPKADPSCPAVSTTPTPQTTIDVLAVVAPDFVSVHGGAANAEARINNLLSSINTYYANSKVAITLRRVATINVDYPSAASQDSQSCSGDPEPEACDGGALDRITASQGAFANVPLLRSLYGADMVMLLRGGRGTGGASGVAWIGGYNTSAMSGSSSYMYAVAGDRPGISPTLLAHELGHNMGNHHDPSNAGTTAPGATSYAYGWTRCGSGATGGCPATAGFNSAGTGGFGTIMSYWRPTLARFSNPNDTCSGNGSPTVACSSTISSASPAFSATPDETRVLNCMRAPISAFRAAHVANCTNATQDTDGDGIPNCVESALGNNGGAKDNDIFAATRDGALRFAMQQYRDFLAREADPNGLNFWTNTLFSGTQSRAQMVESYFASAEFQGAIAPVARLYFAYLLRIPDYGGLQYWIGQFRGGMSLSAISQAFANSPEFNARYGALTNAGFVALVYQNVLGRAPDAGGLAYWVNQLNAGMTRGDMMVAFSESPEYRNVIGNEVYVTMMYVGMLRRSPDTGGFAYWTNYLDSGNSGLALINAFLAAPEYRNRFL
jgi:hypothetical protein